MKLKKLIKDLPIKIVKGSKETEITGLCSNSKLVSPGNLFIARKGRVTDGTRYIPEAIDAGAVAILSDMYDPSLKDVTQLVGEDINAAEGPLAAAYYQDPSDSLFMVGITGTNGKTTSTFLVKHLLDSILNPCGLIGTIEYIVGNQRYQATRTTPDVISNQKMLREMVRQGCKAAVMEVTSHALDQDRVANIAFDVAVFTNLTLDHLDYHETMEEYFDAKKRLFLTLDPNKKKAAFPRGKIAVVNVDSPWAEKILAVTTAPRITYGIESEKADLRAQDIRLTVNGTSFTLSYKGESCTCQIPLIGRFNVYNSLVAIAVGLHLSIPLAQCAEILRTAHPAPGRLQMVPNNLNLKIFVDFAHSDDALTNVLECLRELKKGRIITVFGCGGDRDRIKRPKMAQAAGEHSDYCIVTSDNPRSEDPDAIIKEIVTGFGAETSFEVEPDRRKAIQRAIAIAEPDDIILIAGKGHETYQIFAHKTIEFDDAKVATQLCAEKASQEIRV